MNKQLWKSVIRTRNNDEEEEPKEEKEEKNSEINEVVEQKLLENRQIFLWGAVEDETAKDIVSKLLYLENTKPGEEITFFINSPGGVISSGMAIIDTMHLITSPVKTVCMGLAASMGSLILSAGAKNKRLVFPNGKIMIHQPSVEFLYGQATDLEIQAKEIIRTRDVVASMLAKNCHKSKDKVLKDLDRDYWMNAEESIKYGIVDDIYKIK
ncbi:MAG: ATP-dependent Clp protease, protease subunit [Clostridiales bacterium]|jgi:ATP-dependent Clp protease protease subunit|nr:ATP-dependent Clp protease, protease subunit [Clostridiales bacterium]MDN5281228.1 ATP-dependent Clp protease, protease subunit [Candidatus Ozemobacter sp.]